MAAIVINVAGTYDDKAIKQAQASIGKLGGTADAAGKKGGGFASTMGKGLKGVGIAAGVAGVAFAGAATTLVSWGKEAQASLSISRSTEQIIKATGGAAKISADQVAGLAETLSEKTGIDDDVIQQGQNMILTFKNVANAGAGQAAIFDRATTAALDLSATGFGSVESASVMLGKALNDPTKGISALSRAGVTFTEQQKEQISALQESGDLLGAQKIILAEVESQVGGVAEAAASPFDRLNTMLGNFKEEVGEAILPAVTAVVDAIGPVLDQLAGPLGTIAGQLAETFASVFASIQPLLAPLLAGLTQVVGVLASGFMTAIQALVPAVVPLVTLIAELATRLAPILAPILSKVASVLSMVLAAVMPLLAPLADLILNIFMQAAPILDLVVSVIQTLVTALTPVLAAVSQLIPPLSTLITVLFSAIMPILQPLLPIIELLANILGTILVKAISVLMMGLGYLIQGFSQLAPFILENVTIPVVGFFFDMVESVLSGANTMLGWIPGLGDQLQGAVDAFGGLKAGVEDGMQQAADTVREQGGALGKQLQEQGLAMFEDPNPPKAAASTFTGNLAGGLEAGTATVVKSGQELAKEAAFGTKEEIKAQKDQLVAESKRTGEGIGEGLKASIDRVKPEVVAKGRDLGAAVAQAVKEGAQVSSPSKITLYVGRMIGKGLEDGIKDSMAQAAQAGEDAAREALDKVKDRARDFFDFMSQVRDSLASFGSITSIDTGSEAISPTASGIVANMRAKLQQVRQFGQQLASLKKLGLNNSSLQEILAAGPDAGGQIAAALLAQGQSAIGQVNQLERQYMAASTGVGRTAAESQFGMAASQARAIQQTNIEIKDQAIVINVGAGTSAADTAAIRRAVSSAVTQAVNDYAREQRRQNRTSRG